MIAIQLSAEFVACQQNVGSPLCQRYFRTLIQRVKLHSDAGPITAVLPLTDDRHRMVGRIIDRSLKSDDTMAQ